MSRLNAVLTSTERRLLDQANRHHRQAERPWRAEDGAPPGFFFFGTLMDRDVLAQVLDRPVGEAELQAARLPGYRRVATAGEAYPMLVPDADGAVDGVVLRRPSGRDAVRIRHFEEDEFFDRQVTVTLPDGRTIPARAFFAIDEVEATDAGWDFGAWARQDKTRYLQRCRHWMQDCPE